jgi:predicted helicase
MAKIFHAHLHGDRVTKYDRLMHSNISNTAWSEIFPQTPFYLLTPQDNQLLTEYNRGWKITEIMPVNVLGFQTHRDHFAIDFDKEVLQQRISEMKNDEVSDHEYAERHQIKDNRDWKLKEARKKIRSYSDWKKHLISCSYRPFDSRPCYFNEVAMDYPRRELVDHVAYQKNLCLNVVRQTRMDSWQHAIVSNAPTPAVFVEIKDGSSILPLYLFSNEPNNRQISLNKNSSVNFSSSFLSTFTGRLGYTPTPEAIFHYIYAIFHSPTYRSRYAEFLKIDFPRVPLTRNDALFRQLAAYGEELVALHLMKSAKLEQKSNHPQFVEQEGKCIVEPGHPKYEVKSRSVIINKKGDRFTHVPEAVWNFYVGGYPVCAKWLKDRKGRTLSPQDIAHYQQIVVALGETITLMAAIDQAIPGFPIE